MCCEQSLFQANDISYIHIQCRHPDFNGLTTGFNRTIPLHHSPPRDSNSHGPVMGAIENPTGVKVQASNGNN